MTDLFKIILFTIWMWIIVKRIEYIVKILEKLQ